MIASAFLQFAILLVIPLFFSILARIFKHESRLMTQLALCLTFVCLAKIAHLFFTVINFNIHHLWLTELMMTVIEMALIFGFLWFRQF